jgi:prepilin-type N-terminal cleavage/methylation domain-containing protein
MKKHHAHHHGLTLLEMLLCILVVTILAVTTAKVLGDGRVLRERAKHRAELALFAQGELDRLRAVPLGQLAEGQRAVHRDGWPASVRATETIQRRGDGFLELIVRAERKSPGAEFTMVLTTIHPGGRR